MEIDIREIMTTKELEQVQEVEEVVWQDKPTPIHQTLTTKLHGGVIIGAFLGKKLIGFQYSFPGYDGEHIYLVSHSLAVLPEYRKLGIGAKLKHKQAEVAANKGYDRMIWTFDPLESVNAYLNLHKLGAEIATYMENHYGEMDDGLNKGMPTDRFQVDWYFLRDKEVVEITFDQSKVLLDSNDDGRPEQTIAKFNHKEDVWFVAIPENIQAMKLHQMDLAIEWRMATRDVFQLLLRHGYIGKDIIRSEGVSYYCFVRQEGKSIE
ncbi:GNAT family N-acetyltransferase [Ornithinibacillus halotolerans]|uniref:N-acetyltransferase domain-containing protein n=1 Tax=Ornithinibacillus halotolerans TaxID=1274357 RepID=A0A916W421_9BACI|nr:GNAT family N-acetyltransferase [Ornithinibacillus halotolerans]GGA65677.1 hypothetical protein GCM10008025_06840 [Ornithinibacillus halotolerans]